MKWFQVDSDTPDDPKIKAIIRVGLPNPTPGQAAAGALLLLWCYVANHGGGDPGEGVDTEGMPLPLGEMADECLFEDQAQLVLWLDFLAAKRHIDPERWNANQTVVLPAMRHRADSYAKSKGRERRDFTRTGENPPGSSLQNKQTNNTPQTSDLFELAGAGAVTLKPEDLVGCWNQHRVQGPAVRQITDSRRTAYRKALQIEPNLGRWADLFMWIETQKWMNASGTGDHPTWRADLDFVTKPKQIGKLFDRMAADARRGPVSTGGTGRVAPTPGKFAGVDDD